MAMKMLPKLLDSRPLMHGRIEEMRRKDPLV